MHDSVLGLFSFRYHSGTTRGPHRTLRFLYYVLDKQPHGVVKEAGVVGGLRCVVVVVVAVVVMVENCGGGDGGGGGGVVVRGGDGSDGGVVVVVPLAPRVRFRSVKKWLVQ